MYFVYILLCSDGTYYAGTTIDLAKRVAAHNLRKSGAKYTHARRPVKLLYSENLKSKGEALKREAQIKRLTHAQKAKLMGIDPGSAVAS